MEINKISLFNILKGIQQRFSLCLKSIRLSILFFYVRQIEPVYSSSPQSRILIIIFGGIGDCLLCETLLYELKKEKPDRKIDVFIASSLPLFKYMQPVDSIILAPPDNIFGRPFSLKNLKRLSIFLADRRYEEAIELLAMVPELLKGLNSAYTGMILAASKAPIRIGRRGVGKIVWKDNWRGGKKRKLSSPAGRDILTHIFEPGKPSTRNKHESLLARQAVGFDYPFTRPFSTHPKGIKESKRADTGYYPRLARPDGLVDIWAEETINRFSENGKYLIIGVNMESSYPLKGWAEEHFIAVMQSLMNEGVRFLILGRLSNDLTQKMKGRLSDIVLNLSGKTGFEELLSIISRCDLFFSIDSGPAHLAQAYQVPTLVLFGPSNDKEFGPLNPIHSVIIARRDCGGPPCVLGPCPFPKSCMENIWEEKVIKELVSMIRRKRVGNYPFREFPKNTKKEIIIFQ